MIQGSIWLTIFLYLLGAVVLMAVTYAWLNYRLKKKVRDDANHQNERAQAAANRTDNKRTP